MQWKSIIGGLLACWILLPATGKTQDTSYTGTVQVVPGTGQGKKIHGRVFLDANRNSLVDRGEPGIGGVLVSNGREVVVTDSDGVYELPVYDGMNLFITKPAGYTCPVSEEMIPQFSYIHKPAGSPPLRHGGIAPTGPLPAAVHFPLIPDPVGDRFSCLVFGDTQTTTPAETDYIRRTIGRLLAAGDNSAIECLLFTGDLMDDNLSLYPQLKKILAAGKLPLYFIAGNHDVDLDATWDGDSLDTFRREWGPEYYSFDIGKVHFIVLDNIRYPCNSIDAHPFCQQGAKPSYNGVVHKHQLEWLENDVARVPADRLIVIGAHIPFVSFTHNRSARHQTDNLDDIYRILGTRPVLGLFGHTHTGEQILPGEAFAGWAERTNTGPARFHQILTGAVAGSWWAGWSDQQGIPHATQRLGNPRGFFRLDFTGSRYTDTFQSFDQPVNVQLHASINSPHFRRWATKLLVRQRDTTTTSKAPSPGTTQELGELNILTPEDLAQGSWVAINVWNSSRQSIVEVALDSGAFAPAKRTQQGRGEDKKRGPEFTDPLALVKQFSRDRRTFMSSVYGAATDSYTTRPPTDRPEVRRAFQPWMFTDSSSHLWTFPLPKKLTEGIHTLAIKTVDRYQRTFHLTMAFTVVAHR